MELIGFFAALSTGCKSKRSNKPYHSRRPASLLRLARSLGFPSSNQLTTAIRTGQQYKTKWLRGPHRLHSRTALWRLLTLGDADAYMSDGELTGTEVEIDATVTLKVDRVPGFPNGGVADVFGLGAAPGPALLPAAR